MWALVIIYTKINVFEIKYRLDVCLRTGWEILLGNDSSGQPSCQSWPNISCQTDFYATLIETISHLNHTQAVSRSIWINVTFANFKGNVHFSYIYRDNYKWMLPYMYCNHYTYDITWVYCTNTLSMTCNITLYNIIATTHNYFLSHNCNFTFHKYDFI